MEIDHLRYKPRAVDYLSDSLREGTLVLVLGAGASVGFGLPNWITLVERMAQRAGLKTEALTKNASADHMQSVADQILREFCKNDDKKFIQLVSGCLYEGVELSNQLL